MTNQPNGQHDHDPSAPCGSCGAPKDQRPSAWDLCYDCLEYELSRMTAQELGDVPGAVLNLVGLHEEHFHV